MRARGLWPKIDSPTGAGSKPAGLGRLDMFHGPPFGYAPGMRKWTDRIVLVAAFAALVPFWVHAYATTAADPVARARSEGRLPPRLAPGATLSGGGVRARLPAGVSIDPATGAIVGLALEAGDGVRALPWDVLQAYQHQPGLLECPPEIRELDGQRVVMLGFLMAPYAFEDIREFDLVMSHWSCCYGVPPGLSGSVHVVLSPGARGLSLTYQPIRVEGTFRLREMSEAGIVFSMYGIDDAVGTILDW